MADSCGMNFCIYISLYTSSQLFYWKIHHSLKSIRNYIRHLSATFSISSLVSILMTSFSSHFTVLCAVTQFVFFFIKSVGLRVYFCNRPSQRKWLWLSCTMWEDQVWLAALLSLFPVASFLGHPLQTLQWKWQQGCHRHPARANQVRGYPFKSFVTREMRPKIISCINTGSKISTLTTASSCCFFLFVFRSSFRFSKKEETVLKLPCVLSKFQVIYVHSNTMLTDNFIGEC